MMLKNLVKQRVLLCQRITQTFAKFDRVKPHINVGTIGHIDHGKTTLTSAITKFLATKSRAKYIEYGQIDKAPQEKARGITINTATLEYQTEKRHYAHVDCPGHIDYVKNMITGAAKMDAGILVVSAADGPMPMTKEHVLLCRQIGVQSIIIFLNKMDLIKQEEVVDVIEEELKELLAKHQYDPAKAVFIRGSALAAIQGTNAELGQKRIQALLDAMDNHIPIPPRLVDKPFIMPIENTYNIAGRGAVASGTIQQGRVKINDQVQLVGYGVKIKTGVTGIQTFNKTLDYGQAGDNVGILLRGLTRQQLRRGLVMSKPGTLATHSVLQANIYCLKTQEGGRKNSFTTGYRPQLYYKTADTAAQIKLPDNVKIAMPGDNLKITCKLNFPITISKGSRFALREGGRTIAAGIVTQILPQQTEIDFGKVKKGKPDQTPNAEKKNQPGKVQVKPATGASKGAPTKDASKSAPKDAGKPQQGQQKEAPKPAQSQPQKPAQQSPQKPALKSTPPPVAPKPAVGKVPPPPPAVNKPVGKVPPPPPASGPKPGTKTPPPPPPAPPKKK